MVDENRSLLDMLDGFAEVARPPTKWRSFRELIEAMANEPPRPPEPAPPLLFWDGLPGAWGMTHEEFARMAYGYPVAFVRDDGSIYRLED